MRRRTFLQTLPAAAAAFVPGSAAEVPVKLGFDTYSLRAFKWTGVQLLDYAASQKLDTAQYSAVADYRPLEPENLRQAKERAARLNISLDSGMGCTFGTSQSRWRNARSAREQMPERVRVSNEAWSK